MSHKLSVIRHEVIEASLLARVTFINYTAIIL